MGVVATYKNRQFRPKGPGVAISNHLSPNDVQLLFAGTPPGSPYGYVITGQKHTGIIGILLELWFQFGGPVLLFPEGYCSNNTQVLQFRKAIFEEGIKIYPIAIKQDSRFGDAFWHEDAFSWYLVRVMCSWATPVDITYLPPLTRLPRETNVEFAARAQALISNVVEARPAEFGGLLWYSKHEQRRLLELQKEVCAVALLSHLHESKEKTDSDDGYFSMTPTNASHCSSPTTDKCGGILSH
ncbi:Acyltransferase [Cooperia oncophora]